MAIEAGSELSEHERDSKSIGILRALLDLLEMELSALLGFVKGRLSSIAHAAGSLAAVCVVIQDLPIDLVRTTWGLREADWHGLAAEERLSVCMYISAYLVRLVVDRTFAHPAREAISLDLNKDFVFFK